MVWCAIWPEGVIGPFFFNTTVNAQSYLDLLEGYFWPKVQHHPALHGLYFQHDGAPAHYAKSVRDWLDEHFPGHWLGRRGPIEWPPRSPDITPPDFFLWGAVKERVYAKQPQTMDELKQEIKVAVRGIPQELCRRVCHSVLLRVERCLEMNGGHVEPFH